MSAFDPLVSIIIPSFNHERFIQNSILSALNQTYKNREVIVIDDGSTDSSQDIILELQALHGFKTHFQSNKGICSALNYAINEISTGSYISILASDDLWASEKLKEQLNKIKTNRFSEFCYSKAQKINEDNIKQNTIFPRLAYEGKMLNRVFLRQHVPAGTMFFSRSLFNKVGGFDNSLKEEDWDFVIRCAAQTEFTVVKKPLLYYRQHAANTMIAKNRKEIFNEKFKILKKNKHYVNGFIYYLALSLHFIHDRILGLLNKKK